MVKKQNKLFNWVDGLFVLLLMGIGLFIYGRTLTPGLLPGDSGEFQTLAALWGHTHPTGYPVYLTLAKLFTVVPLGEIAYRVNLFSAVMGVVTAVGLYIAGRLITNYRFIPFVGALALVVSPTFWSQAIIAEVYTAGAAFIIWIIVLLLWWAQSGSVKASFAAGFLGGLSLGVHMSVVLLAPAMGIFLLLPKKKIKDWKVEVKSLIFNLKSPLIGALVGLAITISLFLLMNWNNPTANYFTSIIEPSRSAWGLAAADVDGPVDRLLFGWSAKQFRTFMFDDVGEVMPQQAADYWENLTSELALPLLLLAAVGAGYLLIRQWQTAVLLLVALVTQLLYFFNYQIWDLYVFYIPSYLLFTLLAIVGMGGVADVVNKIVNRKEESERSPILVYAIDVALATAVFIFAIFPIFQPQQEAFVAGAVPFAFDEYPIYDENLSLIATAIVLDLPENAIVFTDWDMVWPYYYAAVVENGRSDLTFIETYPADDQEDIADSVLEYVTTHLAEHPIFFTERDSALSEAGYNYSPARVGPARMVKIIEE